MNIAVIALVKLEKDKLLRYNAQSIGLAKGLAARGCSVDVYSFEQLSGRSRKTNPVSAGLRLIQQDALGFGGNTVRVSQHLESGYDCILCFSDIQISYAGLDDWCRKMQIPLFPYVGVIRSSSRNRLVRFAMDGVARRNLGRYRNRLVFAKTTALQRELEAKSVSSVLAPVGLDLDGLQSNFSGYDAGQWKEEIGFQADDRVLLFVGRLMEEKRPLELLELFRRLRDRDSRFKLCIIGDGHLRGVLRERIAASNLTGQVRHFPAIRNSEMWKYYRMAEVSLNLNLREIFGMSILEAMYYRTPVVARRAPGPEMIISHGEDGHLCDSDEEIIDAITAPSPAVSVEKAHQKIVEEFSWERTSGIMLETIQSILARPRST